MDNFNLYAIHSDVRNAQISKDTKNFKAYHKFMVTALQKLLTKNIKQKTNDVCTLMICPKKTFQPNILLKVLVEYRDMDLNKHSKISKYKFKVSDKILNYK